MGVFTRFHCMCHFFWGYWEIVINGLYDIDSFNLNTPCSFWDSLLKGWGYLARCKKRKKCLFSDLVCFFRTNQQIFDTYTRRMGVYNKWILVMTIPQSADAGLKICVPVPMSVPVSWCRCQLPGAGAGLILKLVPVPVLVQVPVWFWSWCRCLFDFENVPVPVWMVPVPVPVWFWYWFRCLFEWCRCRCRCRYQTGLILKLVLVTASAGFILKLVPEPVTVPEPVWF